MYSSPLQLARDLTKNEGSEAGPQMLQEQEANRVLRWLSALKSKRTALSGRNNAVDAALPVTVRIYTQDGKTVVKNPLADLSPLVTMLCGYKHVETTRDMKHVVPLCNEKRQHTHTRN